MIHFLVPGREKSLILNYLESRGLPIASRFSVASYEEFLSRDVWPAGTWVMSALDRLGPAVLELLRELATRAEERGTRILNHPARALTRYDLLVKLHREGWNDFQAWRLADIRSAGLRFPIFLRDEATHEGPLTPLLRSKAEVMLFGGLLRVAGYDPSRLIAIEYRDTSSADGYYRKYASYMVGDRILARSFDYGRSWALKRDHTEFSLPMIEEERSFIFQNPHQDQLRAIFRIAGTDFGRIDYAVSNGRVVTWEINLYPTIASGASHVSRAIPPEVSAVRSVTTVHFHRAFAEAWKAVDVDAEGTVELKVSPALLAAARAERRPRRRVDRIRDTLSPLRLLLRPVKDLALSLTSGVDQVRKRRCAPQGPPDGARPK